jgi:hypothetical protein
MSLSITNSQGYTSGNSALKVYDYKGILKTIGSGITPPPAPVVWGTITGIVTNQTDLITYLSGNFYPLSSNPAGYLTQVLADGLYYPLSSNPAGYLTQTAADLLYYPISSNPAGYLTDAPSDGSTYGRNNGAWTIVSGSGTLVALPFTTDHITANGNPYVVGDVVYYLGNVYRCIANNDSILPTSPLYWTSLGPGYPLVQQPSDWNSTTGNNQILNKPTIPAQYNPTAGTGISITGAFPNQTIANTLPDLTVSLATTGSGFSVTGTYPNFTLENTLPDQTVVLNSGTGINVTGTYPTFTIDATGGGSGGGRSYYLNGSVVQGTFAGITDMRQMSPIPVIGVGTDFTISSNGYIKSFITDAGDPNKAIIPAGNWNFELWFSASSGGGSPNFYVELYKYDTVGATFTLIATGSGSPEGITNGTTIDLYFTALSVPQTTLALTDRLAVRVFVDNGGGGRTITLHTQGPHLSQIITDFPSGIVSLNGLTAFAQSLVVGTAGTDFGISSSVATHTFNLPTASALNRGALSSTDWSTFNDKVPPTRTITINGNTQNLSADASFTIAAGGSSATIGTTIDGSGGTITVGQKGYVQVPYACTITAWRLIANTAGSIVVDIWKTAAPTIPTVANVITASAKPTLSSQQTATSSTLTGWTTSIAANDIIGFNVNSATTVSWVILQIFVTKI